MRARPGHEIFDIARAAGFQSLFVVGTGKNVGKTVTMRAVYDAACSMGYSPALASIGRDGEAVDIGDTIAKPRLFLRSGTCIATARDVLPDSPASRILDLSPLQTAAGTLVYARVENDAFYELVGPPTASGIREVVTTLRTFAPYVIVDGAVDRIAALAGGSDAVIVACGASASNTLEEAVEDIRGLVTRLNVPRFAGGDAVRIDGALTATIAAALIASKESRAVVVRDPTQILLSGKGASRAFERLTIRCERALTVIAVTVASIGRDRTFEPREFAREVASRTGLPTFDVFTAERAA